MRLWGEVRLWGEHCLHAELVRKGRLLRREVGRSLEVRGQLLSLLGQVLWVVWGLNRGPD